MPFTMHTCAPFEKYAYTTMEKKRSVGGDIESEEADLKKGCEMDSFGLSNIIKK